MFILGLFMFLDFPEGSTRIRSLAAGLQQQANQHHAIQAQPQPTTRYKVDGY
jgi:hypothetical protein